MSKEYIVKFNKDELSALLIQIGGRLDELKELQFQAGKDGNIERVLELDKFMIPILSSKTKMENELYKY